MFKLNLTFSASSKIVFDKYCILNPGLHGVGGEGYFCDQNFISQKVKVSPGTHLIHGNIVFAA